MFKLEGHVWNVKIKGASCLIIWRTERKKGQEGPQGLNRFRHMPENAAEGTAWAGLTPEIPTSLRSVA